VPIGWRGENFTRPREPAQEPGSVAARAGGLAAQTEQAARLDVAGRGGL